MSEKNQSKISKILLAIDKSGYKDKATAYAITLAKALGAEVTVVHVIGKSSFGATGDVLGYYRGGKLKAYQDAMKRNAEKLLNGAVKWGEENGISMQSEVLVDSSAEKAIIDYAKKHKMDLIVIGTKGMTGIEKFLMGSVANHVVTYAHCPVLAIR
ncbi:MAG TPA: universal stress protein [Candidatus Nitrosotalea sp.]|nr:universal stress protein [Nitrososphaerota archaeon]HKU32744.1 universal stress protein [Candidatus Nitrosotalea sp.]